MKLGFRKTEGISLTRFKNKFNRDIFEIYPFINDLIKHKILILDKDYLRISFKNIYQMNEILVKFM